MTQLTDLSDAWAAAMWRAGWQGGLAALAVWSVCRLAPSMPARFQSWLWRLVVLKFAFALLWSAPSCCRSCRRPNRRACSRMPPHRTGPRRKVIPSFAPNRPRRHGGFGRVPGLVGGRRPAVG